MVLRLARYWVSRLERPDLVRRWGIVITEYATVVRPEHPAVCSNNNTLRGGTREPASKITVFVSSALCSSSKESQASLTCLFFETSKVHFQVVTKGCEIEFWSILGSMVIHCHVEGTYGFQDVKAPWMFLGPLTILSVFAPTLYSGLPTNKGLRAQGLLEGHL